LLLGREYVIPFVWPGGMGRGWLVGEWWARGGDIGMRRVGCAWLGGGGRVECAGVCLGGFVRWARLGAREGPALRTSFEAVRRGGCAWG